MLRIANTQMDMPVMLTIVDLKAGRGWLTLWQVCAVDRTHPRLFRHAVERFLIMARGYGNLYSSWVLGRRPSLYFTTAK